MLNVHDEESAQVHDRSRRDAEQDRRLMNEPFNLIFDTIHSIWRFLYDYEEESDQGYDRTGRNAEHHRYSVRK